jgi:hypothetical protein
MPQYALDYSFSKSFDAVAKHYDSIKPIVSKYHTREADIRPFGSRRKKFERIEKVSDNKYVIYEGAWRVSNTPMVWERTERGDILTVRTGMVYDNLRIAFLNYTLPAMLELRHTLGGHNMMVYGVDGNNSMHFLPRVDVDEDYNLQFLHRGNTFECISDGYPIPRKRVNKENKAAIKAPLEDFYAWVCDIGKMLPYNDWDYHQKNEGDIAEYRKDRALDVIKTTSQYTRYSGGLNAPLALEIVKDYNHPLRTHLACHFLQRTNSITIHDIDNKDDASRFRSSFNQWANETLGLVEVVTIS